MLRKRCKAMGDCEEAEGHLCCFPPSILPLPFPAELKRSIQEGRNEIRDERLLGLKDIIAAKKFPAIVF